MSREKTSLHFLKYAENYKSFKAGEIIFKENDPGLFMYVVKKGAVELRHNGVLLETVDVGNIFGEMALLEHSTRSATAIAATDCQVVPLDEEKFTYLVKQTPYFAIDVLRVMAQRLRHSTKEIASMSGMHKVSS